MNFSMYLYLNELEVETKNNKYVKDLYQFYEKLEKQSFLFQLDIPKSLSFDNNSFVSFIEVLYNHNLDPLFLKNKTPKMRNSVVNNTSHKFIFCYNKKNYDINLCLDYNLVTTIRDHLLSPNLIISTVEYCKKLIIDQVINKISSNNSEIYIPTVDKINDSIYDSKSYLDFIKEKDLIPNFLATLMDKPILNPQSQVILKPLYNSNLNLSSKSLKDIDIEILLENEFKKSYSLIPDFNKQGQLKFKKHVCTHANKDLQYVDVVGSIPTPNKKTN